MNGEYSGILIVVSNVFYLALTHIIFLEKGRNSTIMFNDRIE